MDFLYDPATWVAIATFLFVALVLYLKVPGKVGGVLDARSKEIADELEAARLLREEAQALLASYQRRTANAEQEAQEIVERAQREAEQLAAEMKANMEETVARRTAMVEEKIAQAEAQAVQEVRALAVDVAIAASRKVIAENLSADRARTLVDRSIADIGGKLH